jgi:hypothetical protein
MRTLGLIPALLLVGLFVCSQTAVADSVIRTWSSSDGRLSAQAEFQASGADLIVILTNTATSPAEVPTDVLTAVYFELDSPITLTPVSGMLNGSIVLNNGPDGGGNVGGEYGFRDDLDQVEEFHLPPNAGRMVISAVGVEDLVGTDHVIDPLANLWDQRSPADLAYGLVSLAGIAPQANTPLHTKPLVQNAVEFTLSGLPMGYELGESNICKVAFNYGTDPHITPLPSASLLGGAALGAMGLVGWWRRRRGLEAAA